MVTVDPKLPAVNEFGDDEVIFQDVNASCHQAN